MNQRRAVILTALQIERQAVIEHLREVTEEPPVRGSIYRRGIFDDRSDPWEIIVAEIGAGNPNAAAETIRILSHYSPEVAVFVGVAGGIKDLKKGDVVASSKVYGYESGKDEESFKTRPSVHLSAYDLEQRARFEAGEKAWIERIKTPLPRTGDAPPHAILGPIAAGEKVVASNRSHTFKQLRNLYGDAVAVEMEGHGFLLGVRMNQGTQGLVVRGISDLIEGKDEANDEAWQPIAARHAAAFAFQVLAKLHGTSTTGLHKARIDTEWQQNHLQDIEATAGPRYSTELSVETPLHEVFEALCCTQQWKSRVRASELKLSKLLKRFLIALETKKDSPFGAPFPEHLIDVAKVLATNLETVSQEFENGVIATIAAAATAALPKARELHGNLRTDLESRYGSGRIDSASFRQFHAEYQAAFPAANLDRANDLVEFLEELEAWGNSGPGRASTATGLLLLGDAGMGKTHAICDIAHDRGKRGLYTVVMFGEQFAADEEPWERIRQILGFSPGSREDLLKELDAAGNSTGHPLLLCIDGLNESRPRKYWPTWLASVSAQVSRYPNIRLCASCRSSYEAITIPEGHSLVRVVHSGFQGIEFPACRGFFSHYGLEPPISPGIHPEFTNPLFLKLVCKTLQARKVRKMPAGWRGLYTALQAFLNEFNKSFAREFDRDERERIPEKALHDFISEAERQRHVYVRWNDAAEALRKVEPSGYAGPSILDWLIRNGLLITDVDPGNSDSSSEEIVRIAFERLGDHLFAARLLLDIKPKDLKSAIRSGALAFALGDENSVLLHQGLIEALSIQIPETNEFGCELIDALPADGPRDLVLKSTIAALPWRDPGFMTDRTQQLVLEGLGKDGYGFQVFDSILSIATQE